MSTIVIQGGDDSSVLLPAEGALGYTARATARQWPGGEALQTWSTANDSIVVDDQGVHLLTDGAENWLWTTGEIDVLLTAPDGATTVVGPYRVRVRPLISHA